MNWKSAIELLTAAGMPLDDIAAEMGVTTNAIREILAGRTKSPRAAAAIKLLSLIERGHAAKPASNVDQQQEVA